MAANCPSPDNFEALIAAAERSVVELFGKLAALREIGKPAHQAVDHSVTLGMAKGLCALRRLRDRHFEAGLFREPGWDILLSLYIARVEGRTVTPTSICLAAALAPTTAQRCLTELEKEGHLCRHAAEDDDRVILVEITQESFDRLSAFLMALGESETTPLGLDRRDS